tara:strand:- start:13755 stop:14078 length:324 start_codon:yes stop_codon:yes gene_type:complete
MKLSEYRKMIENSEAPLRRHIDSMDNRLRKAAARRDRQCSRKREITRAFAYAIRDMLSEIFGYQPTRFTYRLGRRVHRYGAWEVDGDFFPINYETYTWCKRELGGGA